MHQAIELSKFRAIKYSSFRTIESSNNRVIEQSSHRTIESSSYRVIELSSHRVIESSSFRLIEFSKHRDSRHPPPLRHARPDAAAPAAEVCAASRAHSVRCRRPQCLVRPAARAGVRAQPHGHWRASGVPAPGSADTKKGAPRGNMSCGGALYHKKGGDLLSHIAVQYHRRARA